MEETTDAYIRSRIAPTPSGFLHLGNIFSFVLTWLIVRQQQGHLLLRIDDLDSQRRRIEYIDDIFSTLDWLGLDYDEGASGTTDFLQNYSQEHRLHEYEHLLNALLKVSPPLVFACSCSRAKIQKNSLNGLYAGTCRDKIIQEDWNKNQENLTHEGTAWRIKVPTEAITFGDVWKGEIKTSLAESMGDFTVRKKDGVPAYQIASLSDDKKFNINYIVRGEDLINSTSAQVFLAQLLHIDTFINASFLHHPLLYAGDNQKLSKSAGSTSVKSLREKNSSPIPIFQWIARQLGINSKLERLRDILEKFDLSRITEIGHYVD